jgi:transmembrane sensor
MANQMAGEDVDVIHDVDVAKVTGWRDGRIFLENLTLADAVAEMNKHSSVQVRIEGAELARVRVNGMFRAGDQDAFVMALKDYFSISAERHGEREIVLEPHR